MYLFHENKMFGVKGLLTSDTQLHTPIDVFPRNFILTKTRLRLKTLTNWPNELI